MATGPEPYEETEMDKYSHSRVYGLSFLFPNRRAGRKYPEIVVSTSPKYSCFVETFLESRSQNILTAAQKYLRSQEVDLVWKDAQPSLAFITTRAFGVNSVVEVRESDGRVHYHFPLVAARAGPLALSVHLLLVALDSVPDLESEGVANTRQLLTMRTCVDNDASSGWGHMMNGDVYPDMRRWLARIGSLGTPDSLKRVRKAMVAVTSALNPEYAKLFAGMCEARVSTDGRFILQCPGNACDVAIYPEGAPRPDSDERTRFGCHNLDSAHQQLTLLAGLAALHELAVEELG